MLGYFYFWLSETEEILMFNCQIFPPFFFKIPNYQCLYSADSNEFCL